MVATPYNNPLIPKTTALNPNANLPTLNPGYLLVKIIPIISVPPVDPVADKIWAIPIPTSVPAINTLVNKSGTNGALGMGMISNRMVCTPTAKIVLAQKLLLIAK